MIADRIDLGGKKLVEDSRFVRDFGLDSIQMLELHAIAAELGVSDVHGGRFETLGDLRTLIRSGGGQSGVPGAGACQLTDTAGVGWRSRARIFRPEGVPLTSPLSTEAFELTLPARPDIPFLYALATSTETGHRWRYHGRIPPIEKFEAELWQNVLTQFVVRHRADGEQVGQVVCYGPDITNGHAYLGAVFTPRISGSGHPVKIVQLFLDYLFAGWRFHKIYMEVPESNFELIRSGSGRFFEVEGRLKRHYFYQGRDWDQLILAVTRERFSEMAKTRAGASSVEPHSASLPKGR